MALLCPHATNIITMLVGSIIFLTNKINDNDSFILLANGRGAMIIYMPSSFKINRQFFSAKTEKCALQVASTDTFSINKLQSYGNPLC